MGELELADHEASVGCEDTETQDKNDAASRRWNQCGFPAIILLGLDLRNETDPSQSRWERENAQGYGLCNHDHACHPEMVLQLLNIHVFSVQLLTTTS